MQYQTIESFQLYLNSKDAVRFNNSTKHSDVIFQLADVLNLNKNTIEVRMGIINAQIPYSFYQINSTNNTMYITISGVKSTITLINGNYSITTFITMVQTVTNLTISYNDYNHLLIFTGIQSFSLSDGSNSCFSILGLVSGQTYSSVSNIITAPFQFNLWPLTRLNIGSCCFIVNNVDSNISTVSRTLATIPINAQPYGMILYNNPNNFRNKINTISNLNNFHIQFYDDSYNPIDFQNCHWTMTIQFDVAVEHTINNQSLKELYDNEISLFDVE